MKKTNALRILDKNKVKYDVLEYSINDGISGASVAKKLGENENQVFKTLVTVFKNENYVFIVPVSKELNLKKAAKSVNVKNIEMLHQKDLFPLTGYVHGGCSPIGMKKLFKTIIDKSAIEYDYIFVSAGKIGMQIKINPNDLANSTNAEFSDLLKED